MKVDLEALKSRRGKTLQIYEKKIAESQKTESSYEPDPRFWQLKTDEKGTGSAVIRFLPTSPKDLEVDSEALPWVMQYYRNFTNKKTGKFYNELDLSTLGQKDPVHIHTTPMWKGTEAEIAVARERKRKTRYVANIIVIKDNAAPETEGKVFLFSFGVKLYQKLEAAMFPEEELEDVVETLDPFDFWSGANFHLKCENVSGYRNYDKSKFLKSSPLFSEDDDELIKKVWESQHSLLELNDPSHFKSYEELEERYLDVISDKVETSSSAEELAEKRKKVLESKSEDDDFDDSGLSLDSLDDEVLSDDSDDMLDDDSDEILEKLLA